MFIFRLMQAFLQRSTEHYFVTELFPEERAALLRVCSRRPGLVAELLLSPFSS